MGCWQHSKCGSQGGPQRCNQEFADRFKTCMFLSGMPQHRSWELYVQAETCQSKGFTYFMVILRAWALLRFWGVSSGDMQFGLCLPRACERLEAPQLFGVLHAYLVHAMPGTPAHVVIDSQMLTEDIFATIVPLWHYAQNHVQEICVEPNIMHQQHLGMISGLSIKQPLELQQQAAACSKDWFQYFVVFLNLTSALNIGRLHLEQLGDRFTESRVATKLGSVDLFRGFSAFGVCFLKNSVGQCSESGLLTMARKYFLQVFLALPSTITRDIPMWGPQTATVRPYTVHDATLATNMDNQGLAALSASGGVDTADAVNQSTPTLKIFIYPLPDAFNEGLVARLPDATGPEPMHSEALLMDALNTDVALGRCFARYEHRVLSPEDADYFLVPSYMGFFVPWGFLDGVHKQPQVARWPGHIKQIVEERNASLLERLSGVSRKFFDRRQGRDHLVSAVSGGPVSSMESLTHPTVRILDAIYPQDTRRAHPEYMMRWGTSGGKDIIVPWRLMRRESDYPPDAGMPVENRQYLLYYAASFTVPSRARRFRKLAAAMIEDDVDSLFINLGPHRSFKGLGDLKDMAHAKFCLDLPGDTVRTERPFDALLFGCIPVLLSTNAEALPFDEDLHWHTFSLQYNARLLHQQGRLLRILRAIPVERLRGMQARGRQVRSYFSVDQRCDRRPNGFDLVLRNLARQLPEVRRFRT